ncbi:MAG TPA: hypothetical protein VE987_08200 [Polyangiaceae bacterium]|nr:hypothetical protein [Polyangiaceae bacterium]
MRPILAAALLCVSCTPAPIAAYGAAEIQCVEQADARAEADACRARARAALCAQDPSLRQCLDAGGDR